MGQENNVAWNGLSLKISDPRGLKKEKKSKKSVISNVRK